MIELDFALHVQDATRRFDLEVRLAADAPVAALYGPSGAGKSLTLQAIAGLLRPSRGRIAVDGRVLFDAARGIDVPPPRRRIGYLFQHYALFPHLSVRQNVAFGLTSWRRRRLSPEQAERVDGLLDSFGLADTAASRPATLSGGQQQRVALARALACDPRLLLLDEPFAALNPMLRGSLRTELAEVARRWNIPVMMITHDVDDVLAVADLAFVYEQGRIVREVDVRDGQTRERAHEALGAPAPAAETPLRRHVRGLLHTGPTEQH